METKQFYYTFIGGAFTAGMAFAYYKVWNVVWNVPVPLFILLMLFVILGIFLAFGILKIYTRG